MTVEDLENQNIQLRNRLLEIELEQYSLMEEYLVSVPKLGSLFSESLVDSFAEGGIEQVEHDYWPGAAKDIKIFLETFKNARNNAAMV